MAVLARGKFRRRRFGRMDLRLRSELAGYLFLAPMVVAMSLFVLYPLAEVARLSLTNSNGVRGSYVGLSNYAFILHDPAFRQSVANTLYIGGLSVGAAVLASLVLASLIRSLPAYQALFKTVYFLPNVTSAVAAAIGFLYLFYPSSDGWVNVLLGWFHLGPFRWFTDPNFAPIGMVVIWVWHSIGYLALIWLAGLQGIPLEVYEAAAIDGAGRLRTWWSVTVPLLRPILLFILVIESIASFKRFADVYQIGGADGQPGGSLTTMMVYVYRYGFANFSFGIAAAASVAAFLLALATTLVIFGALRERT
jgi:multiple sugar transport system permease protein